MTWDGNSMLNGEFLDYVVTHSQTPRAGFTQEHARRLYELAGQEYDRDPNQEIISLHHDKNAMPLVILARARLMTPEHYTHLELIQHSFRQSVSLKYEAGVRQHGGSLWTKPGIIDKALEEVVDMYVFLYTLKMQLENPNLVDSEAKDIDEK